MTVKVCMEIAVEKEKFIADILIVGKHTMKKLEVLLLMKGLSTNQHREGRPKNLQH